MSDVSKVTRHFPTVNEGFVATTTGVVNPDSSITTGTVPLSTVAGLTNGSIFVGIIEPGVTDKQQVFTGVVDTSGSQITDVVWTRGTDTGHAAGVTVVDYTTGTAINMLSKGMLVDHNQDGTHGDLTVTSLVNGGTLAVTGASTLTGNVTAGGTLTAAGGIKDRVTSTASSATITPNCSTTDVYVVTAQAAAATIAAPTGTPSNAQGLLLRIKDNGTARALTWNAIYRTMGVTLPTTTVAGKELYVGMRYNSAALKWDVLAIGREG